MELDDLPQSLREVADVVGLTAAARLAESWGGIRLYVPEKITPEHEISRVIGYDAARLLSQVFARETLSVPRAAAGLRKVRNKEMQQQYNNGISAARLALQYGMTERQVYDIVKRGNIADENQTALPF